MSPKYDSVRLIKKITGYSVLVMKDVRDERGSTPQVVLALPGNISNARCEIMDPGSEDLGRVKGEPPLTDVTIFRNAIDSFH